MLEPILRIIHNVPPTSVKLTPGSFPPSSFTSARSAEHLRRSAAGLLPVFLHTRATQCSACARLLRPWLYAPLSAARRPLPGALGTPPQWGLAGLSRQSLEIILINGKSTSCFCPLKLQLFIMYYTSCIIRRLAVRCDPPGSRGARRPALIASGDIF
jgi:hypothetical protein